MNYGQARKMMKTARSPAKGKPIGNNTRLFEVIEQPADPMNPRAGFDSYFSVRLHRNEILRIYRGGFMPMDAGWQTVTTKARLNEHMPIGHIHQRDFTWYFTVGDAEYLWSDVHFVSTHTKHGDYPVMLYSTHPKWPSQVQEMVQ